MVGQVQVIGILMIVQGALASLMGLFFPAMGAWSYYIQTMGRRSSPGTSDPAGETMMMVMTGYYVVAGILALVAGILNVIGGIRVLKFRGRTFALVALFANIAPIFTCYCTPTSIGMMVYGLIVMFNNDVTRAFQMAEEGVSPADIRAQFRSGRSPYGPSARPDWEES